MIFIHNKYILSQKMNIFLLTETKSGHKKYIQVTENKFLWKEINSRQKNLLSLLSLLILVGITQCRKLNIESKFFWLELISFD